MIKRKLMIVVEETGEQNGKGFMVYLAGDIDRVKTIAEKEMSPAEFWGTKLFQICAGALKQTGVVQSVTAMPDKKDGMN